MKEHHIYCISGMGLDERLFYRLNFHAHKINFIQWIEPLKKESFEDYARRMLEQVPTQGNNIFIGISFGGMLAIEMAKLKRTQQVIIISSIKTKAELPWFFHFIKYIPIYKWSKPEWRRKSRERWGKYFGLHDEEALDFIENMFEKTSETYKDWAIKQIANWQNIEYPSNLIHIHGTKDLIFPLKKIRDTIEIENGSHFMVLEQAYEISKIINERLGVQV